MTAPLAEILTRKRASIFFHAPWSGPSNVALRVLQEELLVGGVPRDDLCVVDVSSEEKTIHRLMDEGLALHGYGEAAVVRDGKIRYFVVLGQKNEAVAARVSDFLHEHRA